MPSGAGHRPKTRTRSTLFLLLSRSLYHSEVMMHQRCSIVLKCDPWSRIQKDLMGPFYGVFFINPFLQHNQLYPEVTDRILVCDFKKRIRQLFVEPL